MRGEDFILQGSTSGGKRISIVSTTPNLKSLERFLHLYTDRIFKTSGSWFTQIYTIQCYETQNDCSFGLCPDERQKHEFVCAHLQQI